MHTIKKHQLGKILNLIKTGIGVADWMIPTHLDMDSRPIPEYVEDRAKTKYKFHKVGKYALTECAQFVNKYFGVERGGSAWNHNYVTPLINGYDGIKQKSRSGNKYENHMSYNFDAADNFKNKFNEGKLNKNQVYVVNMYYTGSPWDYKSRNGNQFSQGTHTGLVVFDRDKNKWIVRHNFHGDIMEDPLNDLIGTKYNVGITSLMVPTIKNKFGGILKLHNFKLATK